MLYVAKGSEEVKKYLIFIMCFAVLLLTGCFRSPLLPDTDGRVNQMPGAYTSARRGSPLVTGTWNNNVFTNDWTRMSFVLPDGFVNREDVIRRVPQHFVNDFVIWHEELDIIIVLSLIDVTQGEDQYLTAEDFLNNRKIEDTHGTYYDEFGQMSIGEWDYTVMRGQGAGQGQNEATTIIIYTHRFVGTMIEFVVIFPHHIEEAEIIVNEFLNSIEQG